jgi:hypothetical protein
MKGVNMDTSGKAFVEHWSWAATKGLMNKNTASSLRYACLKILSALAEWETIDIMTLDIDATLLRFQNLSSKDFTPESLSVYKRRFKQAVQSFKEYTQNPSSWKPSKGQSRLKVSRPKVSKARQGETVNNNVSVLRPYSTNAMGEQGLVEYPFPLRENIVVTLRLPSDLKLAEVRRLTSFMKILTVDFEENDSTG